MRASWIILFLWSISLHGQPPELVIQSSHNNDVSHWEFSPDERFMATTAQYDGNNILITELRTGLIYANIQDATDDITSFKFTNDNRLVYGSDDGFIRVFDLEKAQTIFRFETERGAEHIDVHGDKVLVGQYRLEIYNLSTGELQNSLDNEVPRSAIFLKDGRIASNHKGALRILNSKLEEQGRLQISNEYISEIKELNNYLLVKAYESTVLVNKNNLMDSIHLNFEGRFRPEDVDVFEDLVLLKYDRRLIVYNAKTRSVIYDVPRRKDLKLSYMDRAKFYRNASQIVLNLSPTEFLIYQLNQDRIIREIEMSQPNKVFGFGFTEDGKKVYLGTFRELWSLNLSNGQLNKVRNIDGIPWQIEVIGDTICVLHSDKLALYYRPTSELIREYTFSDGIKQYQWGKNHKSLFVLNDDGELIQYDAINFQEQRTYSLPSDEALNFDLSRDNKLLVVAMGFDKNALLFSVQNGKRIKTLIPPRHISKIPRDPNVNAAAFEHMENAEVFENEIHIYGPPSLNVIQVKFSDDGKKVTAIDAQKMFIWDVESGGISSRKDESGQLPWKLDMNTAGLSAVSGLGNWPDLEISNEELFSIHIYDQRNKESIQQLKGHTDMVQFVRFSPSQDFLASSSEDGSFKIWDVKNGIALWTVSLIDNGHVVVDNEGYYLTTKEGLKMIAFRKGGSIISPEQLDPLYNRPDLVLSKLHLADANMIKAYNRAYQKRLKKLNFNEAMLKSDFNVPEISILNMDELSSETDLNELVLKAKFTESTYDLDRINVWVNDVAIYGISGKSLRGVNRKELIKELKIPLARGSNKIQVSVSNSAGVESYREEVNIRSSAGKSRPDLYVISIGISLYEDSRFNLTYASKDAVDVVNSFVDHPYYGQIYSKSLLNDEVTIENVQALKDFLNEADINDQVLIFIAGHGLLDKKMDYYYASHDMDFEHPELRGISYETIESILDGIKPLRKLLFMDTCHSGEVDEDAKRDENGSKEDNPLASNVNSRAVVVDDWVTEDEQLGLQNTTELMRSMFADFRKGTGATVISAAGGLEYALESNEWKNGLFTYCLLSGMKSSLADLDGNGEIWLGELQEQVFERVIELSGGSQRPTSRIVNRALDYRVY
ncbi:MAG: caspase family protein [Bacteroidia bacterium]